MKAMLQPKTLIIGSNGFIGSNYFKAYTKVYGQTLSTDYQAKDPLLKIDLLNPSLAHLSIKEGDYSHCLIAAGKGSVAYCEENRKESATSNVEGILALAKQLHAKKIVPIIFSSDYVFDGVKGNYTESSPLSPTTEYGRQKAALETAIPKICGKNYLILRLSKIFGTKKGDGTLLDEMISRLEKGDTIRAACDQLFCPLCIDDLIEIIFTLQNRNLQGLYNVCGPKTWSRYTLATKVAKSFNRRLSLIEKISLNDLGEPFLRPKNTTMSSEKIQKITGAKFTDIKKALQLLVDLYLSGAS